MIDGTEAERIGMVDHLVAEDTAFDEYEGYLAEYASTNSAGCRGLPSRCCSIVSISAGRASSTSIWCCKSKAMAAPDFAEAMEAYRAGRDPRWE